MEMTGVPIKATVTKKDEKKPQPINQKQERSDLLLYPEDSFLETITKEAEKAGKRLKDTGIYNLPKKSITKRGTTEETKKTVEKNKHIKRVKKSIFISYAPDAPFSEKFFICELIRSLRENGFDDDIWFDKNDKAFNSAIWLSSRLEKAEKCRAVIIFLSQKYAQCPVTQFEASIFYNRCHPPSAMSLARETAGAVTRASLVGSANVRAESNNKPNNDIPPPPKVFVIIMESPERLFHQKKEIKWLYNADSNFLASSLTDNLTDVEDKSEYRSEIIDLREQPYLNKNILDRCAVTLGKLLPQLEPFCLYGICSEKIKVENSNQNELKNIVQSPDIKELVYINPLYEWTCQDVVDWMTFVLKLSSTYREKFTQYLIDGFLLLSLTDSDMNHFLGVDSLIARKKIIKGVSNILRKEQTATKNWHLRLRGMRKGLPNTIYLIYDPTDVRLVQTIKNDLSLKKFKVLHHGSLGQSKEEFLHLNGPFMAEAAQIVVILTDSVCRSPFSFQEIMFSSWLGKRLSIAMFSSQSWSSLRFSFRAVLGQLPAVDFHHELYQESFETLLHFLRPGAILSLGEKEYSASFNVVLEEEYLLKLATNISTLKEIATLNETYATANSIADNNQITSSTEFRVFISYHWDDDKSIMAIKQYLECLGIHCLTNTSASSGKVNKPTSMFIKGGGVSPRINGYLKINSIGPTAHRQPLDRDITSASSVLVKMEESTAETGAEALLSVSNQTLNANIQRLLLSSHVLIVCITPTYVSSEQCWTDLAQAIAMDKPLVFLMFTFMPWPPKNTPPQLRRIFALYKPIDLSNNGLLKINLPNVIRAINKAYKNNSSIPF